MHRKLAGYFLLTLLSFCFFTGIFHTVVNAQISVVPGPTDIFRPSAPTPTLYVRQTAEPKQTNAQQIAVAMPTPTIFIAPQVKASPTQTPTSRPEPTPTTTQIKITPTTIPSPTATPIPQTTIAVVADLETLFNKYSEEYHADKELLKKIARCESGFNTTSNNSGMYLGMFQFSASTWSSTRTAMGLDPNPELRTNAEEAIKTAAYKIANGGVNAWPNCH